MRFFPAIFAAVGLLLVFSGVCKASPFSGLPITQIMIQDDQARRLPDPEELGKLVVVRPGDLFSSTSIREGIRYLYLTGKFQDIRVEGFPDEGGVRLVYTVVPVTVVDRVDIRGNHSLATGRIKDVLAGLEGRELRQEKFPDFRTAIMTLYQSEGYYGANIDFRTEPVADPHHVILRIYIREPERTLIADVDFGGNTVFTKGQLVKVMKNKPGKPLRTDVLFDQDMAAILEKYADAGYPTAKPGPVDISFREEQAYLYVSGKEGPKVSVSFTGNRAFSDKQLRKAGTDLVRTRYLRCHHRQQRGQDQEPVQGRRIR